MCLHLVDFVQKKKKKKGTRETKEKQMLRSECSANLLSLESVWPAQSVLFYTTAQLPLEVGGGTTQPSVKGSPSGEAMHGFEPTQAREVPLLLHKVF